MVGLGSEDQLAPHKVGVGVCVAQNSALGG